MSSTYADEDVSSGGDRPTLYSILGVPHDATPAIITKSYRAKALTLHPDRIATADRTSKPGTASSGDHHPSPTIVNASEHGVFAQVTEAYQTLVDPDRRAQYDAALFAASSNADENPVHTTTTASTNKVPRPDSSHVPDFLLGRLSNSRGGGGGGDQQPANLPPRSGTPIDNGGGVNSRGMLYRSAISSSSGTRPSLNRHQVSSTPLEGSRRIQTPLSPPGSAPFDDLPANMHKRWDQQFKVGKAGKVERRRTPSNAPPLPMSASGGPRSNSAASVDQLAASNRDMASRGSAVEGGGPGGSIHGVSSFGASFFKGFTTCAPVDGDDDLDEANAFPAPTFRPRPGDSSSISKRTLKGVPSTPQRMLPFRPPSQTDIVPDRGDEDSLFGTLRDTSAIQQQQHSTTSTFGAEYSGLMVGENRDGATLPQRHSPTRGRLLKRSHLFSPPHHQQQRGVASSPSPTRGASPERATPLPSIGGVGVRDRSNLAPLHTSSPVFKGVHRMLPSADNGGPQIRRGNPSITKPHLGRVRELAVVSSMGRLHQLENEVNNGTSEREETKRRVVIRQLKQRELYLRAREETSRVRREAVRQATEGVDTSTSQHASGHVVFTREDGTKVSDFSRSNATTMSQVPQMSSNISATTGGSSPHRSINRSAFVASVVEEADAALAALRNRSARMKGVAGSNYSQIARDRAQKVVTATQFRQPQILASTDIPQRHHVHPIEREHRDNWARLHARAKTVNTFFGDATGPY